MSNQSATTSEEVTGPSLPNLDAYMDRTQSLTSLRGAGGAVGGARGVSLLASTDCTRHRVVIAAGTTPEELLPHVYGGMQPLELSPFAVEAGLRFERELMADDAAKLRQCYRDAGIADIDPGDVLIVDDDPGSAVVTTEQLLADLHAGNDVPSLVIQPRLHLDVCGQRQAIRPDVMVLQTNRRYRVGEIKSHLDHDGNTDGSLLAAACRQGAVGILALAESTGTAVEDHPIVDVFLRRDDRNGASLRTLRVDAEIHAIVEGLAVGTQLVDGLVGQGSLDDLATLTAIPHRYRSACHGTCAFADACFAEAWQRGDLAVMGTTFGESLVAMSTLAEARESSRNPATALGAAWQRARSLGLVTP